MNKYEFRSAYSKIALSEEFKAAAKEKLIAQYGKMQDNIPDEADIDEQRVPNVIKITPKEHKPWKAVLGIGSAAAVVGIGIWGSSLLWGKAPVDPASNQGSTSETSETSEPQHTDEPIILDDERFGLVENSVTFPAYYDMVTEYNQSVFSALPFELDISLPEGWHFEEPAEKAALSMLELKDEKGDTIGSADFNVYEIYPDLTPEQDGYYRMVYNQLMLNSMVNWDSEYTIVKQEGGLCSATCRIITDAPDRFEGRTNGYGILAHNDDLRVYVNISINKEIDDELHAAIARSVDINESIDGIAERIADDYLSKRDTLITQDMSFDKVGFYCKETGRGHLVFAADANLKSTGLITYYLCGGRMYNYDYITADSVQVFEGDNDLLLVYSPKNVEFVSKEPDDDVVYTEDNFYKLNSDGEFDFLCSLTRAERNGEVSYCSIKEDIDSDSVEITYEQYLTEKIKLLQGYSQNTQYTFGDFVAHNGDRDIIAKCVREAFNTDDEISLGNTDILEMKQHTFTSAVYHLCEDGNYRAEAGSGIMADIGFSLPVEWELDHSVAYLDGNKVFEIGVPYPEEEGIDYENFRYDRFAGVEYTVHEEKIGTENDPFAYYIYRSAPEKYSADGSYDAYWYVINDAGFNLTIHFIADSGVDKGVIEQVLKTVHIKYDNNAYTGSPIYGVNSTNKRIAESVSADFFESYVTEQGLKTGSLNATAAKTTEGMIISAEHLDTDGIMVLYAVKNGILDRLGTYEPYKTDFAIFDGENGTMVKIVNKEDKETSRIVHKTETYFEVEYLEGVALKAKFEYDYSEADKTVLGAVTESFALDRELSYEQYIEEISDITSGYTELECGVWEITEKTKAAFSDAVRYAINETDGVYREPLFLLYCDEYRTGLTEYVVSWLYEGEEYMAPSWMDRDSALQMLYDYGMESYMSLPVYEGHTLYAEIDEGGVITAVKSFDANLENAENVTSFTKNSITFPPAEINSRHLYEITVTYPQGTVVELLGIKYYSEEGYRKQLSY